MKGHNTTKIIIATRSSMPPMEEYVDEIKRLWNSCWLSNEGAIFQDFNSKLKSYLGVENLELFVNGHMSLELALSAMDLKGEVITTPFTFISTANAIVRNGLKPVFCDIRMDNFNMDAEKIEPLINENTSAIVPVHIYGSPCDVEAIEKLAQKYSLKVIYDAAQAFGVTLNGRSIMDYGDASMVSFHATKTFHTIEGGAVVYRDSGMGDILSKMGSFGTISKDGFEGLYPNAKMNEFQAAMGICNLRHFEDEIAKRKRVYERYKENLKDVAGINLVPERDGVRKNHTYMPLLVAPNLYGHSRDELIQKLADENIFAGKFFAPLIVKYDYYKDRYTDEDLPVARYVSDNVMSLPMFAEMEMEDVDRACSIIREFQKNS